MSDTLAEPTEETAFLDLYKKFAVEKKPNSALRAIQEAALSRFETLGFPHSKHEMYTFVNTKNLSTTLFKTPSYSKELAEELKVKIDGGEEFTKLAEEHSECPSKKR